MKWVGFPDGLGVTLEKLETWLDKLEANRETTHYVISTPDAVFCGEFFYRLYPELKIAGLDIKLMPEAQGQGIATQALNWLIETVFENEPEVKEVFTEPNDDNQASQKLYARCGLESGPRPETLHAADSYWALDRNNWKKND